MRRIDPVNYTLSRSLDQIYPIEDADLKMSASSEFPERLTPAFADVIDAEEERKKRRRGPDFEEEEAKVTPLRRRLYSRNEIQATIGVDRLCLLSLLQRTAPH